MTMNTDTYMVSSLKGLGLSDKEARIYEACLSRGEINVIELARIANVSRSTAYFVADELVKKGLLRFIQRGAHRIYTAEDPRQLQTFLEQEQVSLSRKNAMLQSLLPGLNMRYAGATNKPVVSYYVGQHEMRKILEDALLSGDTEILYVGEAALLDEAVGSKYLKAWIKRRIEAGIATRGIRKRESEIDEPLYLPGKSNLRETRFAPEGFHSPVFTVIYSNKVAYISSAIESYGVLIESKDLSTSMRSWFSILWETAGQTQSNKDK